MMTYDFTDLQQTAENRWQARYQGNYGVYTVKIEFDENGKRKNFSCTCPSDGYPCKHIGFLQTAIKEHVKEFEIKQKKNELTIEEILQNVSLDELRAFVIKKAKFNNDLTKAITLEFAEKLKVTTGAKNVENIYSKLVRNDLCEVEFDGDDYYEYDEAEVDLSILGEWYNKAKDFIKQQKYNDALLVCKAVIEEYAEWYEAADDDMHNFIYTDYQDDFFDLLREMAENGQADKHSLYEYCKQELSKKKYSSDARKMFSDLMVELVSSSNSGDFIAMQKELLEKIPDKSSREAEQIVQRLYIFYLANDQKENANELVEQNLQIARFCKMAIEKRIAEKRLEEAKQLILKFEEIHAPYNKSDWNKYKLDIAQKGNDIPAIRRIAFEFINSSFDKKYFTIYKSTFSTEEWNSAFEKLYTHYDKKQTHSWHDLYNRNISELLVTENLHERLIVYVETHLSPEVMEKYHAYLARKEPGKTLEMFRKAVDLYAEKNVGESHYANVYKWLMQIKELPDGMDLVSKMIDNYRITYKRRPKMIEWLNKI